MKAIAVVILIVQLAHAEWPGPGCCLSAPQYQYLLTHTQASEDEFHEGQSKAWVQVDTTSMQAYVEVMHTNANGSVMPLEMWFGRGDVEGTLIQHFKVHTGELEYCVEQNVTDVWGIFEQPCWYGPRCAPEEEQMVIGRNFKVQPFTCQLERENRTFALDMMDCVPTSMEECGWNMDNQYHQETFEYFNFDFVITDPNKFLTPWHCRNIQPTRVVSALLEDSIEMILGTVSSP